MALYASPSVGVAWGFHFACWRWLPHWRFVANVALLMFIADVIANLARAARPSGRSRFISVLNATIAAAAFFVTVIVMELDAAVEFPFLGAIVHTFAVHIVYLCVVVLYIHAGRKLGATASWMMGTALLACFVHNWSSEYVDIYGFTHSRIR